MSCQRPEWIPDGWKMKACRQESESWLFYLNFYFLRWFFVRLARVMQGAKQVGWTMIVRRPFEGWLR